MMGKFVVDSDVKADWLKSEKTKDRERKIYERVRGMIENEQKAGKGQV
jgi:hypothetical protein